MPKVTLTVCVFGDRKPLERLLANSDGCYDELLVVHDGPDFQNVEELSRSHGGRFYVCPRAFCHEPHMPYALEKASYDWILKFDSDELPSPQLRDWIVRFRSQPEPRDISGYQCIWPAWSGKRPTTRYWPNKRSFLYHRQRIRYIGIAEMHFFPDMAMVKLPLVLHHEPATPSHGFKNIFGKQRTRDARDRAVQAILGSPLDHPRWRYDDAAWPTSIEEIRSHPILTGLRRLFVWPPRQAVGMLLAGDFPHPSVFAHAGTFHATLCYEYWRQRRLRRRRKTSPVSST
jgi:hypothetical protein